MKKHILPLVILTLFGCALVYMLFRPGWFTSHDGVFHILRTEQALLMMKQGEFPLRWAGGLDQGFGIPLFNFVYPLPYYITAALSLALGSVWAVKVLIIGSFLAGGYGVYFLSQGKGRGVALTLAALYLMTPYQFLNIYVRGALGETVALGLIPWVLYAYADMTRNSKLRWWHPIPLGLLFTAHNFLSILFAVFMLGYSLLQKSRWTLLKSTVISVGLASFFLIPMLAERSVLYSLDRQTFTFRFDQHFVAIRQLLYSKWDYWYSLPGLDDGMSFQLGFAQIAVLCAGSLAVIVRKKRSIADLYVVLALGAAIFLMIERSYWIWKYVSFLQVVQFPWRFLFVPAVLTPILGYHALKVVQNHRMRIGICVVLMMLAFWNVRNYRSPMKILTAQEYTDLYLLNVGKTTMTFRTEILPRWSVPDERFKSDELLVNSGNMTIDSLMYNESTLTTTIHNKQDPATPRVTILRNYYPYWRLTTEEGSSIPLDPTDEGMISFQPQIGVHTYTLKMTESPIERVADIITVGTLLYLGYIWKKSRSK